MATLPDLTAIMAPHRAAEGRRQSARPPRGHRAPRGGGEAAEAAGAAGRQAVRGGPGTVGSRVVGYRLFVSQNGTTSPAASASSAAIVPRPLILAGPGIPLRRRRPDVVSAPPAADRNTAGRRFPEAPLLARPPGGAGPCPDGPRLHPGGKRAEGASACAVTTRTWARSKSSSSSRRRTAGAGSAAAPPESTHAPAPARPRPAGVSGLAWGHDKTGSGTAGGALAHLHAGGR